MSDRVEHIDVLVEERSMEAALTHLIAKIRPDLTCDVLVFPGKEGLMARLPDVLRGYRTWLPANRRIVVVVDRDDDDCTELKQRIEQVVRKAGLKPKASASAPFHVLTRIAVEELEAWFFGDVKAITTAYPRVPASLAGKRQYRHTDAIAGGTWEALERVLRSAGYFPKGLPKIEVARAISALMTPDQNRSPSFQTFRMGLLQL